MLRFLCPLYANKSHQWHILLRITGYKWGGTRLVTRHVAHVSLTVLTCLTPHTVNVLCVLFIFCHCWLTRMAPQQMVQVSLHTGVYCTTGSLHGCIYWLVVWPGRGRPRHWPSVDSRCPAQRSLPHHRPQRRGRWLHPYIALGEMSNIYSSTVNSFVLTYLEPFTQSLLLLPVLTFITLKMCSFKFQVPQI